MGNNSTVPAWIADIEAKDTFVKGEAELKQYRNKVAILALAKDGPELWKQLRLWLEENVRALHRIGIRASMSVAGDKMEEQYRIDADLEGALYPRPTYTTLFYS